MQPRLPRRALLTAALLAPSLAQAHAILEQSDPAANATIQAGKITLALRFNSRLDRSRSRLTLNGPGGTKTILPIDSESPPDRLTASVTLAPGAYTVRWQVLAIDGHITRGDVPFTVTGN